MNSTRLVVLLPFRRLEDVATPAEARRIFISKVRVAILRAFLAGRLELPIAEEIWRALPAAEPRT